MPCDVMDTWEAGFIFYSEFERCRIKRHPRIGRFSAFSAFTGDFGLQKFLGFKCMMRLSCKGKIRPSFCMYVGKIANMSSPRTFGWYDVQSVILLK